MIKVLRFTYTSRFRGVKGGHPEYFQHICVCMCIFSTYVCVCIFSTYVCVCVFKFSPHICQFGRRICGYSSPFPHSTYRQRGEGGKTVKGTSLFLYPLEKETKLFKLRGKRRQDKNFATVSPSFLNV
jgi:hypothetical protein